MVNVTLTIEGNRAVVRFPYDPRAVRMVKEASTAARFTPAIRGGPHWSLPLDITIMRRLREQFGNRLILTEEAKTWGRMAVAEERKRQELVHADDATLDGPASDLLAGLEADTGLPQRAYQRVDISMMSGASVINANQPGTGKTIEVIGAILNAGMAYGLHLVLAPVTSLSEVWEVEVARCYELAGLSQPEILTGTSPAKRRKAIQAASETENGAWVLVNPEMARLKDGKLAEPALEDVSWDTLTVDEFHLCGLSNPKTQTFKGAKRIVRVTKPALAWPLSGTPMDGKPIRLWGALHIIDPERFSSRWEWAHQWLSVTHNGWGYDIGGIKNGREKQFEKAHRPYLIRRTKPEALPGLPPKRQIDVWCHMTPKQAKQYQKFDRDAEWRMNDAESEGARVTANNVLAEYTRLKQFAGAYCEVEETGELNKYGMPQVRLKPTADSGKLRRLLEKLAEEGIADGHPAVIFTQYVPQVAVFDEAIRKEFKVETATITGDTPQRKRQPIVSAFQRGEGPTVLVLNTRVGGASINLSRADSLHITDETWRPSDQEQAEDRGHRGDQLTAARDEVRIYYYRSRGTIEEDIRRTVADKRMTDSAILDLRRIRAKRAADAGKTGV